MDDGSGGGDGLRVRVEAEAGQLGYAELFAQDALSVIVLKDPVFQARFNDTRAIEQGCFRGLEKLLRAGEQRFARVQELQLVAKIFVGVRPGEFRGLKFAGGEIDVRESNGRAGSVFGHSGE